ncbi:NAD(P)/FAD-dependent oxidoreductase [Aurantiacibacter aquimixticola]|uniref:FAD-binding domain-containing protein n=1 Tax=Aurantiacibacter aquimixticola TaxID=1958945 RepID=A0A419RSU8_9SPHN|nr:FAD-dependent oxidoreductase [Aurantiacibacter aquimixticola]RJY08856.1 hypothetical protein D6201_05305 [Aurantiacibacter aquimixticola]
MRFPHPLILGAGPAGCAAAITLGAYGQDCTLLDRSEPVGDPLCGGFLSWRTAEQLDMLGVDIRKLGAHPVEKLWLFDGGRSSEVALPHQAFGLSRHALDTEMRRMAVATGAQFVVDTVRGLENGTVTGAQAEYEAPTLFLATGKHDVRGESRPRHSPDTTIGIRLRLPASPARNRLLDGAIELHLFPGGYVGIVVQEGGSANICLAVRKSALTEVGGSPKALFERLADGNSALAERLGDGWQGAQLDTIGAVPYGWICRDTSPGVYRLGDQAAVIPSLAGEGNSIAIASGMAAASAYIAGRSAPEYQRDFAARARRPVRLASALWHAAETRIGARAAIALSHLSPGIIASFAQGARIPPARSLAQV